MLSFSLYLQGKYFIINYGARNIKGGVILARPSRAGDVAVHKVSARVTTKELAEINNFLLDVGINNRADFVREAIKYYMQNYKNK